MGRRTLSRTVAVAVLALVAAACNKPVGTAAPKAVTLPPAGMSMVFNDEFDGTALDTERWDTCYPWANTGAGCTNFGNPELQWYLPEQAQVSDGMLHLVAEKTPTEGTTKNGQPKTYEWRSGMVTSYRSLQFQYGYAEIVARIPDGAGFWPTFWLLPETMTWPPEVDILENLGSDPWALSLNFHSESTGQHQGQYRAATSLAAGYHKYSVNWQPGSLTYYFDGRVVHKYTGSDVPSEPMYLLANLAISGTELPDASTPTTASFDIDYIRVYQA